MSEGRVLEREQRLEVPIDEAFAVFADARNLQAITPPWLHFRITEAPDQLHEGALIAYRLRVHGLPVRWLTRIETWEPPHRFVDRQVRGPYELWHHTHEFEAAGGGTVIRDRVRYRIGYGPLGSLAQRLFVRRDLDRIFDFRRAAIAGLL
jgi:ligand-binding SRPBCC domain-containing protein